MVFIHLHRVILILTQIHFDSGLRPNWDIVRSIVVGAAMRSLDSRRGTRFVDRVLAADSVLRSTLHWLRNIWHAAYVLLVDFLEVLGLCLALFFIMLILFFNDFICDGNALLWGVFAEVVLSDISSILLLRGLHFKGLIILVRQWCLQVLFDLNLLCVLVKLRLRVIHGLELLRLSSWLHVLK